MKSRTIIDQWDKVSCMLQEIAGSEGRLIKKEILNNALSLIKKLNENVLSPKIALDSEDGILFVWEVDKNPVLAVCVEEDQIHIVYNPGTPNAIHIGNIPFDGQNIPSQLINFLPTGEVK